MDAGLATLLHGSGHDVVYMSDVEPRAADTEVMNRAHHENRLLLTEDKDFGDLVFRQARPVPGIGCGAHGAEAGRWPSSTIRRPA